MNIELRLLIAVSFIGLLTGCPGEDNTTLAKLSVSGVTAGIYSSPTITVDENGIITEASSGATAASGANSDITLLSGLTTPLSVNQGGTGAVTAATARSKLGAAASGDNSDITSLSGLTTPLASPSSANTWSGAQTFSAVLLQTTRLAVKTVSSAAYTVADGNAVLLADTNSAGGNINITLPPCNSANHGRIITAKKNDTNNRVYMTPAAGDTIETNKIDCYVSFENGSFTAVCDSNNKNWMVIATSGQNVSCDQAGGGGGAEKVK